MQNMVHFAWRNLLRNPGRNLLAGITIFMGSLVLLCSLMLADGISEGIVNNLVAIESGSVLVSYQKDAASIGDPAAFAATHQRVLAGLGAVAQVSRVRTRLRFEGLMVGTEGRSMTLSIKGIDPALESELRHYLVGSEGRMIAAGGTEVYLSQEVARQLKVKTGDPLTVLVNTWGSQLNAVDFTVSGVFVNVAPWVDYVAYISLPAARQLYAADIANQYLLDTADLSQADAVVAAVKAALGNEALVVSGYRRAGGFLLGIANANRYSFMGFSVLLFIVVGMGIASLIGITIRERSGELGTLLAIGFEARQLTCLLLLEMMMLAGLALLAAALAGGVIYAVLSHYGIALDGVARNAFGAARLLPAAHPYQGMMLLAAGMGMALLGTWLPARAIFKMNTDDILRKG